MGEEHLKLSSEERNEAGGGQFTFKPLSKQEWGPNHHWLCPEKATAPQTARCQATLDAGRPESRRISPEAGVGGNPVVLTLLSGLLS